MPVCGRLNGPCHCRLRCFRCYVGTMLPMARLPNLTVCSHYWEARRSSTRSIRSDHDRVRGAQTVWKLKPGPESWTVEGSPLSSAVRCLSSGSLRLLEFFGLASASRRFPHATVLIMGQQELTTNTSHRFEPRTPVRQTPNHSRHWATPSCGQLCKAMGFPRRPWKETVTETERGKDDTSSSRARPRQSLGPGWS